MGDIHHDTRNTAMSDKRNLAIAVGISTAAIWTAVGVTAVAAPEAVIVIAAAAMVATLGVWHHLD